MDLPEHFLKADENGCKGYGDWGFMSTTSNREVATNYCGAKAQKSNARVFQICTNSVDRAANIQEYSQYPGERGYLWQPLSFLQPSGARAVEVTQNGPLECIDMRMNADGGALTLEELIGMKGKTRIKAFKNLLVELEGRLLDVSRQAEVDQDLDAIVTIKSGKRTRGYCTKIICSLILSECKEIIKQHEKKEPDIYSRNPDFRWLNEEMMQTWRLDCASGSYG